MTTNITFSFRTAGPYSQHYGYYDPDKDLIWINLSGMPENYLPVIIIHEALHQAIAHAGVSDYPPGEEDVVWSLMTNVTK